MAIVTKTFFKNGGENGGVDKAATGDGNWSEPVVNPDGSRTITLAGDGTAEVKFKKRADGTQEAPQAHPDLKAGSKITWWPGTGAVEVVEKKEVA